MHLRKACEASVKRLKCERIALCQLHASDPAVPLEESIGELAWLRAEGRVRHIGVSNVTLQELQRCERVLPVVAAQNRFNLEDRYGEDVIEYCTARDTAFPPWAPLGSGRRAAGRDAAPALACLAAGRGISTAQVAIACLLQRAPVIVPIPGTVSMAHLEENIAAASVVLTPQELCSLSLSRRPGRGRPFCGISSASR